MATDPDHFARRVDSLFRRRQRRLYTLAAVWWRRSKP
jgi:hypothetical protein